ncbi:MAG TPA: hypothetical protein VF043_10955 [Ktedonobacteraceae bacterium]
MVVQDVPLVPGQHLTPLSVRCAAWKTTKLCSCNPANPLAFSAPSPTPPRVLIANSNLVPHWGNWDEFRRREFSAVV